MAGMLPGVECARRRRFHLSGGGWSDSPSAAVIHAGTRRPSFCLYTSNHESHHGLVSSLQRSILNQANQDDKLGEVAREAKERLDERLRNKTKPETRRSNYRKHERLECVDGRSVEPRELWTEVFGLKKSSRGSSKRLMGGAKLRWKAAEQDECTVCLDRFKVGETLVNLACAHRFHSRCLVPWLENNAHCPCCRMEILI